MANARAGGGDPSIDARRRRRVYWRLWWASLWIALLVQVPGMGTVDSARRMQVARSWWTDEPAVRIDDRLNFGIPGRNGVWQAWYGPGQSAWMLPADVVAKAAETLVKTPALKPKMASAVVATLTFPPLVASTVVLAFVWLGQLGFLPIQRFLGAMSLLLASSHLYYTQVHMENSLQVFLLLLDAVCLGRWMVTGRSSWLAAAAGTVAFALNIRTPALAEHGGIWLASWVILVIQARNTSRTLPGSGSAFKALRPLQLIGVALPVLLLGFLVDRVYHWQRFGSWTGTYVGELARHLAKTNLTQSPRFPFDGDFWSGFVGPWVSLDRGVIFSDPLMIVLGVLILAHGRRFSAPVRAAVFGLGLSFVVLVAFYARYSYWNGATTWGNRFTLTPIHALVVLVLPLWLRYTAPESAWTRWLLPSVMVAAVLIQLPSLLLPTSVETSQDASAGGGLMPMARMENVINLASGDRPPPGVNPEDWRLNLWPATLGALFPRGKVLFWLAWFAGLGVAIGSLRSVFRRVDAWDAELEEEEDASAADWVGVRATAGGRAF